MRSLLALALMLWFAGAGCVFVSYAHDAMSESEASPGKTASTSHHSSGSASRDASSANATHSASSVSNQSKASSAAAHSCCKAQKASKQQGAQHRVPVARVAPVLVPTQRSKSAQPQRQLSQRRSQWSQLEIAATETFPAELAGTPRPSGAMNCCPLTGASATVATRPRVNDAPEAAFVERTTLPAFLSDAETSALTPPLRLPNRGHTYLRCCVFLI